MNRKVLLIEPDYKNKYPPMGLMKLATYYRMVGDDVRFFKGDLKLLAAQLIYEDLLEHLQLNFPKIFWKNYYPNLIGFIKSGKYSFLHSEPVFENSDVLEAIRLFRSKYKNKDYFSNPRFDKVGITTLFTFYWQITIDTINFAKQLCKNQDDVMVGGIMSSLLPDEVFQATGIRPFVGLLNHPGDIDPGNKLIIDELPLDYSILDEIDYVYPAHNAYFAYMTRGCVNKCKFCAVPKLEPHYCNYINLKNQIDTVNARFGVQKDLLLLDNNVLASDCFNQIIDEIKDCGFNNGAVCSSSNNYDIVINNLRDSYNDRAYIKKAIKIFNELLNLIKDNDTKNELLNRLEKAHCLHDYTASKQEILDSDDFIRPLYNAFHKSTNRKRTVDFNQGIDSRLVTDENMKKLSEINISPLRIAFDHWNLRDIYEKAVRTAVKNGIKNLSNYLLYNFEDTPDELYYRLRLNIDLCNELSADIYSFPMKYHPINDPAFFKNRDYIGKHWNRKFIRTIQAILNSTKGKVGKGISFFEFAFGHNIDEFHEILWMPEDFIIYRKQHESLANQWRQKFFSLSPAQLAEAKAIISLNNFNKGDFICADEQVLDVLSYYQKYSTRQKGKNET